MPMSVDEILEAISKMENWDDLVSINNAANKRHTHLTKLELQKFKQGDRVWILDEKGKRHPSMVHPGMVWSVTAMKVKVDIGVGGKTVDVHPRFLEKREAET